MKTDNIIRDKSYAFALRVVNLHKYLQSKGVDRALSNQLLRSGTSVGANIEEALGAGSTKDFQFKLRIAYKEARESHFWLRLLHDSGYIAKHQFDSIISDNEEILKIIGSIQSTIRKKRTQTLDS